MDSLKETDNLATKPSKRPRIEVDEELMRQMIAGQAPWDSKVVRRLRLLKGQTPIPKRVT